MAQEFEVVANPRFRNMHVFLVHLLSRMTHIHQELEIGFVLEGNLSLHIENATYTLGSRDGYLINPLQPHEFRSDQHDALILAIQISPRIFDAFLTERPNIRFKGCACLRSAIHDPETYNRLLSMSIELGKYYLGQEKSRSFDCFALVAEILALLNRTLPHEPLTSDTWQRMERILSVTDYIDANYQRKLLLEEIARRESLTMTYLSHLFTETLGMSFQTYLKKKRFEHARALILGTSRSILDISLESGFSDTRYLIQAFEEEFGCTPRAYRAQHAPAVQATNPSPGNVQEILWHKEAFELLSQFSVPAS